ncbi:MAG: phosphotriesterase [bacterium]|nr:phosphotriesterase [bacterium]
MNRRSFLRTIGTACLGSIATRAAGAESLPHEGNVMAVLGPISPEEMGVTLPHEHVLVDFIGADKISPDRYHADEAFEVILPFLEQIEKLGCRSFVECTPAYLGRDVKLLKRLSTETGMHVMTNTGYYGAANDKFVPKHAHEETAEQLAARWVREWQEGIEGTGIRPGFIKIGVDSGKLSEIDRKLVRAAARTHLKTGLTIASHTGGTEAGLNELEVLREEGVDASAFVWVHAQNGWDVETRVAAARAGAWIEIDNVGPNSIATCVEQVNAMKDRGVLNRVLVSHDAGWYSVGEPRGGNFRPFTTLFTDFIPALKKANFNEADIRQILVDIPREAFTVLVRRVV